MDGKTLFQAYVDEPIVDCFQVTNLSNNSQQVKHCDVFLAYPGTASDGRHYIQDAIAKGAVAVVAEKKNFFTSNRDCPVPLILIDDLASKLGKIASQFFDCPAESMRMHGVTGTNGKTTVCHIMNQALLQLGLESAAIGTLGVEAKGVKVNLGLTTPDAIQLHGLLAKLKSNGVQTVSMEVSSHALCQGRVAEIPFKTAIFTNLTPEHLDYHENMEAYCAAKSLLFQTKSLEHAILNDEDPFAAKIARKVTPKAKICLVTTQPKIQLAVPNALHVTTTAYKLSGAGIQAEIVTPWGVGTLKTKLIGHFNLSNCLLAVAALCMQGYALDKVLAAFARVSPVTGRMQAFGGATLPQVFVDYAHTPDALQQALIAARSTCKRTLWCVFGCGGNRDQEKRKLMGEIAAKHADRVIITNDNPRHESPDAIIDDILQGIGEQANVFVEQDRKKAIEHAVIHALSYDVILVAGKGHESTQTINGQQRPFSDIEWVKQILGERK